MSKATIYDFKCDLCEVTETNGKDRAPAMWSVVKLSGRHEDRVCREKHICADCSADISAQHLKTN